MGKCIAKAKSADAASQRDYAQALWDFAYYFRAELFKEALDWWTRAAEAGDAQTQLDLGDNYPWCTAAILEEQSEEEDQANRKKALSWTQKVAENGNITAMTKLGGKWHERIDAARKEEALHGTASQKDMIAIEYIAECKEGPAKDAQKNHDEAMKWWKMAAEQWQAAAEAEDSEAQGALYSLYSEGRGVEKDPEMARKWLERSQASRVREKCAREANFKALRKAEKDGSAETYYKLGEYYGNWRSMGFGAAICTMNKSYAFGRKGAYYCEKAWKAGYDSAMAKLAGLKEDVVERTENEALSQHEINALIRPITGSAE